MRNSPMGQVTVSIVCLGLAMVWMGCVETHYTIRHIDQHPAGEFNTVETSSERVIYFGPWETREFQGINFWNCRQSESRLVCERICDENWDRICAPGLRHEFGRISEPGAGVVLARYQTRVRLAEQKQNVSGEGDVVEESEEDGSEQEVIK